MRRVVWVSFAPLRKTAAGLSSDVASVRYRLLVPAQAVPGSKVTHLGPGANRRTLSERFADAQAVVFGKVFDAARAGEVVELAGTLKARNIKVLADFSDDHFADARLGPAYRAIADACDRVIASTPELAAVLKAQTAIPVSVVTDPVEGERGTPRASIDHPPQVLWFGHPLNLDALVSSLPQLGDCNLTVMTAAGAGAEQLGHRFIPWSTEALFKALRECDAVVIPSNPYDPRKVVKSPNRFTEALWAGCFVVAQPLPAYLPLAAFGWVGEHLGEGLAWLAAHEDDARERIVAGQEWIEQHCSRAAIGSAWRAAIDSA